MALTRRDLMIIGARSAGALAAMGAFRGAALPGAAAAALPGARDPYLLRADRIVAALGPLWDGARYRPLDALVDTQLNAAMLLVHSAAALAGHSGPSRQDLRARLLVDRLSSPPAWVEKRAVRRARSHDHDLGWSASTEQVEMATPAVDAAAAEALAFAVRAAGPLRLLPSSAAAAADRIHRCASSRFWRFPAVMLNQANWNASLYSADALAGGGSGLLRADYRRQLERFAEGITEPAAGGTTNLGPSYRFHYLPHRSERTRGNLDSAEYANIAAGILLPYEGALAAGMRPLAERHRRMYAAWLERIVCGYWTHDGYLNWDTGLGFGRWHLTKYWALAQRGLLTAVLARPFRRPELAGWARYMLDSGLDRCLAWMERDGGPPPGVLMDLRQKPQTEGSENLAAARFAATAALASLLGAGEVTPVEPPPLYAFDADIGRLAVTTPRYSTAILGVAGGSLDYGGLEPARLLDSRSEVAASIGGHGPATFGLTVSGRGGRTVLCTQPGPSGAPLGPEPLRRLGTRSARRKRGGSWPRRLDAGPFSELAVGAALRRGGWTARIRHRFESSFFESSWTLVRTGARGRHSAVLRFPTTGPGAQVTAVMKDGVRNPLLPGAAPLPLGWVAHFELRSARGGYDVDVFRAPRGSMVRLEQPVPQPSAPSPGPLLAIVLARRSQARRIVAAARITPH